MPRRPMEFEAEKCIRKLAQAHTRDHPAMDVPAVNRA